MGNETTPLPGTS